MSRYTILLLLTLSPWLRGQNWTSFRGPDGSGVTDGLRLPVHWNADDGQNMAWKTRIPGLAHSSPVVWDRQVFVTTAVSSRENSDLAYGLAGETMASSEDTSPHEWKVLAIDAVTGRILWEKTAFRGEPRVRRHKAATHADPTPAVDGSHLIAFFGSQGLYCFDLSGNLIWKKDLGILKGGWTRAPRAEWGFGSSPVIFQDLVLVQCDTQTTSFVAAFRISDGEIVWRQDRSEDTVWSTPAICRTGAGAQLVTSGTHFFRAYDVLSGAELWRLPGEVDVKIPSPVCTKTMALLGGGNANVRDLSFYAVDLRSRGEIPLEPNPESPGVAWKNRAKPHIATPVVYGAGLYIGRDNGVLTRYELESGKRTQRLRVGPGASFTASPVVSDGHLYWAAGEGEVFVINLNGENPQMVARNPVGEMITATPAMTHSLLLVRGRDHLFAFGRVSPASSGSDSN